MSAFLRAAAIGGFVVVCSAFVADAGSAQAPASGAPAAPAASPADTDAAAADAKADPSCKPTEISCAWTQCYPIDQTKYPSLTACITKSCNVSDQDCKKQLVLDVYDPDREQAKGGGK